MTKQEGIDFKNRPRDIEVTAEHQEAAVRVRNLIRDNSNNGHRPEVVIVQQDEYSLVSDFMEANGRLFKQPAGIMFEGLLLLRKTTNPTQVIEA